MGLHKKITAAGLSPDQRARRRFILFFFMVGLMALTALRPLAQEKKRAGAKPDVLVTPAEAANLEAVITTDLGVIRFEFLPDKAPRHVQQFIKWAREGFYDGSAFFRLFARGLIQGGDPNLKDPAKPRNLWVTGALNMLPDDVSNTKHLRGTVASARSSSSALRRSRSLMASFPPSARSPKA